MRVRRSEWFQAELTTELEGDGRPTIDHFETQLGHAVELTFEHFWDDPSKVVPLDDVPGVRTVQTISPAPHMFPPGVFYARLVDDNTIELIGVEFDWDYWQLIDDDPDH